MGIPVMVVDDSPEVRELIRIFLEKTGFDVVSEANNGVSAIFEYSQWRPELIIMDIVMPIMNGVIAAKNILKLDPKAKILLISAVIPMKERISIPVEGYEFLPKPFNNKTLITTIQNLLFRIKIHIAKQIPIIT